MVLVPVLVGAGGCWWVLVEGVVHMRMVLVTVLVEELERARES